MSLIQGGEAALKGIEEPCPVCGVAHCPGHPTNRVGALGRLNFAEWSDDPPKERITMADGITVTSRVFETRPAGGRSKRTTRVLVATPGRVLSKEEAKRLNVGSDGVQTKVPTTEGLAGANISTVSGLGGDIESTPTPESPDTAMEVTGTGTTAPRKAQREATVKRAPAKKAAAKKAPAKKAAKATKAKKAAKARKAAKKS